MLIPRNNDCQHSSKNHIIRMQPSRDFPQTNSARDEITLPKHTKDMDRVTLEGRASVMGNSCLKWMINELKWKPSVSVKRTLNILRKA